MSKFNWIALAVSCSLALVACGGDDDGGTGGVDGGGIDAQAPDGTDAQVPDGTDAQIVEVDATVAPGGDSGTGGGGERDPRLTSDPRANYVACGETSCMVPGQVCCTSLSGQMCTATCGGFLSSPGACDGPEDCGGQRCCGPASQAAAMRGTMCAATCGGDQVVLCGTSADCAGGETCRTCIPNTGPGGPRLFYGVCTSGSSCPSPYMNP